MRFHKLTITMTLACLSLVALVALTLLPISNVICDEGEDGGWDTSEDGYSASFYASQNEDDRSWYLSGNVAAKGVSAKGSVSILNPDRYDNGFKKIGSASVSVYNNSYTYYHNEYDYSCYYNQTGGECPGHTVSGDADSNVEGAAGFVEGRHTDITLDVKVRETKYKLLFGKTKKKKISVSAEVGVDYEFVEGESSFLYGSEVIMATSISAELSRREVTNEAETSEWSVSVYFHSRGDAGASASLSYDGASSGSKSLSYSASGDEDEE